MKTQLLMFTTAIISLFGLTSCFQVESTITVKKDGSGTITEEMILGEQMQMMINMAAAQGGQGGAGAGQNPMDKMLDKEKAAARAKKMGEGVELVSVEKIDVAGKLGVKTTFKFADINKLNYSADGAIDMGDIPGAAGAKAEKAADAGLKFELVDGKLVIIQKAPKAEKGAEKDGEAPAGDKPAGGDADMDPQMMAMMQGMMKDMRVTTKLVIEAGIVKTDASHVDGNTIILSDIQMGKIMANPEKLKAIQSGDFEKTKDALKGVDGIKFEDKERVSVEMK